MATSSPLSAYGKGTQAWFQDKDEGWVSATLETAHVDANTCKLTFVDEQGRQHQFDASIKDLEANSYATLPPLRNPPILEQTEDLTNLSYLNEPAVLHSIRTRYQSRRQIYTYSGIVLVAVNPFVAVPLYEHNLVQAYAGKKRGDLEPHLFAIAEDAYRCMIRDKKDQTIIVSGESGAGKTVSAKYIMRYFATVEDPDRPGKRKASKDGMTEVERQILATNPIMEAFGNAKTTRNDNSSRFGKYIEILFDSSQTIIGARIRTYLLERTRLVYQPETERNYHIFYQLLAGGPSADLKAIGLDDVANFHYLNQGGAAARTIPGVDDAKELKITEQALDTIGITSQTRWQIFTLLGALLHIGNIEITGARSDAFIADDNPSLIMACKLLGVDVNEFKKWTIKKQITTRSEKIVTTLNPAQATVVRDSVAKYIYACLFDWLVSIVNESLAKEGIAEQTASFIGVLDIYGFEHFKKNSFEQFCINYANEKLQQEFNAHVFKLEQEEYVAEKINWTFIDFADNQPTIDVIEGKLGILALLDEESRLPSGADSTLVQKLYQQLGKPENAKIFKKPRFGTSAFTISHYALDVTYEIEGFLEKNRDTVADEHLALLGATTNTFLKEVLDKALAVSGAATKNEDAAAPTSVPNKRTSMMGAPGPARKAGGTARKPTLGSIFKASLISLKETIDSTNAHYIRCIKPNEAKKAWEFEPPMVLGQLRACGVLETIRISCAGYPTRWTFEEFAERYYMLTKSSNWGPELKELCTTILQSSIPEEDKFQVGLTKIFFRAGMLAYLEKLRVDRLNYLVTLMQKNMLRHLYQKRYQNLRTATVGIQATWRRVLAQRKLEHTKKERAVIQIQKIARGFLQRTQFLRTRKAVITLQSHIRGHQTRLQFKEQRTASGAILLQSLFRGLRARNAFLRDRKRVILAQCCVRQRQARNELKTLRVAAKSASHFKEVSYKLENKVVELTQALQKRTQENKEQQAKLRELEDSQQSWIDKHSQVEARISKIKEEHARNSIALPEFQALAKQKEELDQQLQEAQDTIKKQDAEIVRLTEELEKAIEDMDGRQKALNGTTSNGSDETSTVGALRAEVMSLREQLGRALMSGHAKPNNHRSDGPPIFNMATGRPMENGHNGIHGSIASAAAAELSGVANRRRNRRASIGAGLGSTDPASVYEDFNNPRAVSVAFPDGRPRYSGESEMPPEVLAEEVMRLLEEEEPLDEDILNALIKTLKIPTPSTSNPPIPKEVLFPAHLISLVTNELWKYGMMAESERFLANVMQTIQQHVMGFTGEDAIVPGIFWLSNVHEILSFVCIAESDILQGIGPGADGAGREFDWDTYERLVSIVKHDLDSLEYNIYHTWMQETKKKLNKMVIPALVESQSLPGFVTQDGGARLFNKMFTSNNTPAYTMDDILNLLNRVWKSLKSYYVEHTVVQQVITELLKLIGVTSFNDLLMRRNFCSWKRAMQIQYNITRIEEWCKSREMPEGTLQLEHLMQATKLLQLKKAQLSDIEIIFDVCWMLTPTQIQKLISHYYVADYEQPISPEVLKAVASRVISNDKNDHLLLPPEVEDAGPYEVPLSRELTDIETYIPAWLNVPHLRRLTQLIR